MRRTVLSAMTLACTAVLATTVPAFADDATTPAPRRTPAASVSPVPSKAPARTPGAAAQAPREEPAKKRDRGQVAVVPKGAPNTGVTEESSASSGNEGALIGGGAAVLAAGGAAVLVVRRRRATGA
ncbi:Tat pathway signal sequence domain protein [Streptomyces sp. 110]|uniref:Tat pathway signal sequence domain protein n=1 Tax=Streptomyces endocoffeicus TaxID=2898945 RepID=A0ABS1PIW7_9ACTN|nr:Tat pathway signal sequence domain protein [Streptomyces endocoffeicus]MBL1112298.1 Tat pathway signal sequence domain protein [Streptomyces endocoffeicus]